MAHLKVGDVVKTKKGDLVKITEVKHGTTYMYIGDHSDTEVGIAVERNWDAKGNHSSPHVDSKYDLVRLDDSPILKVEEGDRVCLNNGQTGTVKKTATGLSIYVESDNGRCNYVNDDGTLVSADEHIESIICSAADRPCEQCPYEREQKCDNCPNPAEEITPMLDCVSLQGAFCKTIDDLHPASLPFAEILLEALQMHCKKSKDYGSGDDPYANVRASSDYGVPSWVGSLIRANDKWRRIQKFANGSELANESCEDSLVDLCVYLPIILMLYREESCVS